jgi:anti-sigma B factor antagonist
MKKCRFTRLLFTPVLMYTITRFRLIQPSQPLTAAHTASLRQELDECLQRRTQIILVDLHHVTFIDSLGLGLLISMQTRLRRIGSKFYLCAPQEQMRCLMEMANVDAIFEIFASRSEFEAEVVKKHRLVLVQ